MDQFIRDNSKVAKEAKLIEAQSDGEDYIYTYESKVDKKSQTWIISVCGCKKHAKPEADTKSTDSTSTDASKPEPKYKITGVNYVEYS